MIKVTVPNGTAYEFDAEEWIVVGKAIAVYKNNEKLAEFSDFLLVQKLPVEPAP